MDYLFLFERVDDRLLKEFMVAKMENGYWLVWQAICFLEFFGV